MGDASSLARSYGSTSSSLLERAKARDPAAWERLVELYSPLVYYWCRAPKVQPEDAADLLQEVFRSVAGAIGRFRYDAEHDSFRAWLRTITQNKLRNHLRKRRDAAEAAGGSEAHQQLLAIGDPLKDSSAEIDASEQHEVVLLCQRAMELVKAEFEERTWRAFWQVTIDGRFPADVAAELGISTAGVYKAKSRVLARLREEMGEGF